MGIDDASVYSKYERNEVQNPVPRKLTEDRIIYLSRPLPLTFGPPILCDLSEAWLGDKENKGDIMPDIYRAPEVILGMKWDYSVDIWNVAMVVYLHLSYKSWPIISDKPHTGKANGTRFGIFSSTIIYFKAEPHVVRIIHEVATISISLRRAVATRNLLQ